MKTLKITVSIRPISPRDSSGGTVSLRISPLDDSGYLRSRSELREAAINRACQKLYGRAAYWWPDSGLAGYGQVMRPSKFGGSDAITYRARLDVDVPELPAEHLAQLKREHDEITALMQDDFNERAQREDQNEDL